MTEERSALDTLWEEVAQHEGFLSVEEKNKFRDMKKHIIQNFKEGIKPSWVSEDVFKSALERLEEFLKDNKQIVKQKVYFFIDDCEDVNAPDCQLVKCHNFGPYTISLYRCYSQAFRHLYPDMDFCFDVLFKWHFPDRIAEYLKGIFNNSGKFDAKEINKALKEPIEANQSVIFEFVSPYSLRNEIKQIYEIGFVDGYHIFMWQSPIVPCKIIITSASFCDKIVEEKSMVYCFKNCIESKNDRNVVFNS